MMFNQRLKQLREINSLTQKQVANVLGITRSSYAYYELGKSHPDIEGLKLLARLYDVSLDFLLDYNDFREDKAYRMHDSQPTYALSGKHPNFVSDLSSDEKDLIAFYRVLNEENKKEVLETAKELKDTFEK